MGLSGYSSVHCPPGCGSVSGTWGEVPSRAGSNTWNSPAGPAPTMTASALIVISLASDPRKGRQYKMALPRRISSDPMKAIVCKALGPPEQLAFEDVTLPAVKPTEVKVQVKGAGVNFPDTLIIQGKYQFKVQPPFTQRSEEHTPKLQTL